MRPACVGARSTDSATSTATYGRCAFKCSACGSLDVSLWLFAVRAEAEAWAEESGPGF